MIEGEWLKSSGRLSCHNCLLVWGRSVCRGRVGMVGGVIGECGDVSVGVRVDGEEDKDRDQGR